MKFSGTQPSGCSFWKLAAEGRTFYTVPSDHYNCPIGAYTHNIPLPADRAQELDKTLGLMASIGYVRMEEVPGIPRVPKTPGAIVYAPLGDTPIDPDVVLFSGTPGRLMLLQEAAIRRRRRRRANVLPRPTLYGAACGHGDGGLSAAPAASQPRLQRHGRGRYASCHPWQGSVADCRARADDRYGQRAAVCVPPGSAPEATRSRGSDVKESTRARRFACSANRGAGFRGRRRWTRPFLRAREGLLPPATRTAGGFRLYPPEIAERLRFIKQARELGLSLREIRQLVEPDNGQCCAMRDVISARLTDVDRRLHDLTSFRKTLQVALDRCEQTLSRSKKAACPVAVHGFSGR